jgi:hypothetical protein
MRAFSMAIKWICAAVVSAVSYLTKFAGHLPHVSEETAARARHHLRLYLRGEQPFDEYARRLRRLEIPVHVRRRRGTVI